MIEREDEELRQQFATLRREESAGASAFRDTLVAARARTRLSPRRRLGLAAAALALVTLVVILTVGKRHRSAIDLAGVRVHAPTDFLLQLPGAELLRTVPRLGRVSFDRRSL
ncbi:MAG TPA: hypothetical protein VGV12_13430 [Gemmatimonadales bacterium]|nr:hypothetical protein [Gemmatimonadales bacterium]